MMNFIFLILIVLVALVALCIYGDPYARNGLATPRRLKRSKRVWSDAVYRQHGGDRCLGSH